MRRSLVLFLVAAACGGKQKHDPVAPIADAKPAEPAKPVEPPKPEPPKEPEPQAIDAKLPGTKATVKLVSPGKGKREALRYTAKVGAKQSVEIALDVAAKKGEAGKPSKDAIAPTVVLVGDAEVKAVDKDGAADVVWTVTGAEARDVAGQAKSPADLKESLALLVGMTISGTVAANGATGELALHVDKDKAKQEIGAALQVVALGLPPFPALPAEPVGLGAKWEATVDLPVMNAVATTQVTTYELVARKGGTWTIKATTKESGKDQEVGGSKFEKIAGAGAGEITITDGALYPALKTTLEHTFTASNAQEGTIEIALKLGAKITPK
jgi:hypothetical protein